MIDLDILQDASEILQYDSPNLPFALQARYLSEYTDMRALCHWHPDIECVRIYEGEMYYDINGEKILLHAGDSIIVNSQHLHFGYSNNEQECKFSVILLHPDLLKSNMHNYQKNVYPIIHSSSISYWYFGQNNENTATVNDLLDRIFALRHDNPDDIDCLLIGLFHCLWHVLYHQINQKVLHHASQENPDIQLQRQMVSYIFAHYSDNISLDDIAASANISRSKCCKIFQQYLEKSPIAFLNNYRMEISCNLLRNTSYSITEIALSCGYNHLSYYSKMFLRKYGCTPNQYRKQGHAS